MSRPDGGTTVVIVTFNSVSTVREALMSIPSDCEVVVVDQNSSDKTVDIARQTRPEAKFLINAINTGYSAGCNLGARHSS